MCHGSSANTSGRPDHNNLAPIQRSGLNRLYIWLQFLFAIAALCVCTLPHFNVVRLQPMTLR
jgi:hypothetical protein